MSLHKELARIMELANPLAEADKKLKNTYMFVNGVLKYNIGFNFDMGNIIVQDQQTGVIVEEKVTTLEVFLPESGLYPLPNGNCIILTKLPKRQWHKSFNTGYYNITMCGNMPAIRDDRGNRLDNVILISKSKRTDIYVDPDGVIWLWHLPIGYVADSNGVVCMNELFKQELTDWIKNEI